MFDLIIVGSGVAGATIAAVVRSFHAKAKILIVEGGPAIGSPKGHHLLSVAERDIRDQYRLATTPSLQIDYAVLRDRPDTLGAPLASGLTRLPAVWPGASQLRGAAVASNLGGMGIHWTAACPTAFGDEIPGWISEDVWSAASAAAQNLLSVDPYPLGRSAVGDGVIAKLHELLPSPQTSRRAQYMPMAGRRNEVAEFVRTSPANIFPELAHANHDYLDVRTNTRCTAINWREGKVTGVTVVEAGSSLQQHIDSRFVVVASDALRTPQLLWKSHVRLPALGAYLNEHMTISSRTTLSSRVLSIPERTMIASPSDEPFFGAYWLPSRDGEQPFHGQMMGRVQGDFYVLGLNWYAKTEISADNRLIFDPAEPGDLRMPDAVVNFEFSKNDLATLEAARRQQLLIGESLGDFDPDKSVIWSAGQSFHYTGSVRAGIQDNGESVCDRHGAVWGLDNLFVAGNGVIPTALTCNCTLTATTLGVLTAERISGML